MTHSIDFQMTVFLQQYLAIKTVHPCPDEYRQVVDLFVNQAMVDGIGHTVIKLESGFQMLVLSIQGSNKKLPALLLNHHMDVVDVCDTQWKVQPFSGVIKDGYIYGRGVQDMKSIGVVHYAALRELKKEGVSFERSIYLTIVPGEECGGFQGTGQFIKTDFFKSLNVGYVLDEGVPSGCHNTILVMTDERAPLQLKVTAVGQSAHASDLMHHNPIYTLISFLNDIKKIHDDLLINADLQNPGAHSSYHVTWLSAGNQDCINIIPDRAQAVIDIRVAPRDSVDQILDSIVTLMKKYNNISHEILAVAKEKNNSKHLSLLSTFLERVIQTKGLTSKTTIFQGASDMRFYRELGIEAVGCSPFDDESLLHAANERLSLKSIDKAKDIIKTLLYQFCTKGIL